MSRPEQKSPLFTGQLEFDPDLFGRRTAFQDVGDELVRVFLSHGQPQRYLPEDAMPLNLTLMIVWQIPSDGPEDGVWGYAAAASRFSSHLIDRREVVAVMGLANVLEKLRHTVPKMDLKDLPPKALVGSWCSMLLVPFLQTTILAKDNPYDFRGVRQALTLWTAENRHITKKLADVVEHVRTDPGTLHRMQLLVTNLEQHIKNGTCHRRGT